MVRVLQHLPADEMNEPLAQALAGLKKEGKIKGRVAVVHVALEYGVEMHASFLEAAKKHGLEVVFSKNYPLGTADLQPVIREAMGTSPDAFVAKMSYRPTLSC